MRRVLVVRGRVAACHGGGDEGESEKRGAGDGELPDGRGDDRRGHGRGERRDRDAAAARRAGELAGRGAVAQVLVEEGDHVNRRRAARHDRDPSLPAGSIEAQARRRERRANESPRDQELARQHRLVDDRIGARAISTTRGRRPRRPPPSSTPRRRARASRARSIARRELRAPHAGVVLHVWKKVGESVDGTSATPIAEVADLDRARAPRAGPAGRARAAARGHAGRRPRGRRASGDPATVVRVAPAVDPTTLLGEVRAAARTRRRASRSAARRARGSRSRSGPGVVVPADRAAPLAGRRRRGRRVRGRRRASPSR